MAGGIIAECSPRSIRDAETLAAVARDMIRLLTLCAPAALAVAILASSPASAACVMSYCKADAPARSYITNTHRQIIGDLYNPGHNRRTQIRNNRRQILGYIEHDGTITNTRRQEVLSVEPFGFAIPSE